MSGFEIILLDMKLLTSVFHPEGSMNDSLEIAENNFKKRLFV